MKYCKCRNPELMKTRCRKCNLEISTIVHESFSDLEAKKNKLYASGKSDEARLVQAELDFLYYGIKTVYAERWK